MVIDTSAVVAVLLGEPERATMIEAVYGATTRWLSAVSRVECGIVLISRRGASALADLEKFLTTTAIGVAPVDDEMAQTALNAWQRYGRGRHPAGLNLGDCFAYALAMSRGEPLLFKGRDFALTDVTPAH